MSVEVEGVSQIAEGFRGVLLDAYGVFWGGGGVGPLPGAKEAMEKLVASGKVVGILSNSTQLAHKEADKLKAHGIFQGKHYHFLVTSGEVARQIFLHDPLPFPCPKKKFYLFGEPHPKFSSHEAIFQGTVFSQTFSLDEADFIYLSVPHIKGEDQTDPALFLSELQKVKAKGLPMVCSNPDLFAHEGNPPQLVVRQGSLAALYEKLGGQVFYIGKPQAKAYAVAMTHFEKHGLSQPSHVLMVGDTPETDIKGARACGMASALITETGIMAERIAQHGKPGALKMLSAAETPDYFIGKFTHDIRSAL